LPEAIWFKLCCHGGFVQHGIIWLFGFGGRDVADWLQQTPMVEPIDPFQCGELDGLEGAPWSAAVDHFRLVKAIDRFRQSVVITVADAADRWLDAGFCEAFGIFIDTYCDPRSL